MSFRKHSLLSLGPHGFHRLVYYEWGDPDNARVLLCVHGMTRNGRDFDYLAEALSADYRVVCPDLPGRGESEWLEHSEDYDYPLYCADLAALLARLRVERVDWLGTSMGGIIGMFLAAAPHTPISKLVLNDVGPYISKEALTRIATYVGADPRFTDLEQAESYIRELNAEFGPLTDAQWAHYTRHYTRQTQGGELRLNYDPEIALPLRRKLEPVDFFPVWQAIRLPTLIVRGMLSDVLLPETAERMRILNPLAQLVELPGIGHAPALADGDQIAMIKDWLLAEP